MTALKLAAAMAWLILAQPEASAHPLDPALAELREASGGEVAVLWRIPGSQPTAAPLRLVLPPRCVERSAPVDVETGRRMTSTWIVDCGRGGIAGERIAVAGLTERGTDALLRAHLADGRVVQAVLRADHPSATLPPQPSRLRLLGEYFELGFEHIVQGVDHLLLILGFVLLVPGRRPLLWTITAFTVGHSVTLSMALLGVVRIPSAPVEALIAATLVIVAVQLARPPGETELARSTPWMMAFAFGLLHGLGFAGAL